MAQCSDSSIDPVAKQQRRNPFAGAICILSTLQTYTIKYKPCFFTRPPAPTMPAPRFSLSKGQNLSERRHRCFATCEGAVHPFHLPEPLQDSELANSPLLSISFRLFCWDLKTFPTQNQILTNHFSVQASGWRHQILYFVFISSQHKKKIH